VLPIRLERPNHVCILLQGWIPSLYLYHTGFSAQLVRSLVMDVRLINTKCLHRVSAREVQTEYHSSPALRCVASLDKRAGSRKRLRDCPTSNAALGW
jgi:hypothetical protein